MKKRIFLCFAALGIVLSAISGCLAILAHSFDVDFFEFGYAWWTFFGLFCLLGAFAGIYGSGCEKREPPPPQPQYPEFEKFMKECKLSFRGSLKLSILFWIVAYRKEKAKSFEDAKREVFQEVKKEIPHVRWMDAILSEIQEELSKIKQ